MTISRHTARATVICAGSARVVLDVTDAQVTLDESWSPYAQVRLSCAIPPGGDLALIDPRARQRVRVDLLQRFGGSDPVSVLTPVGPGYSVADMSGLWDAHPVSSVSAAHGHPWNATGTRPSTRCSLDLALRVRDVDHAAGVLYIEAASDEALLLDYALVSAVVEAAPSTSIRTICTWVLGLAGLVLRDGDADATLDAGGTGWQPGQTAWDYLRPLVDAAGLRLWCDEHRNFYLTDPLAGTAGGMSLSTDYLTEASDTLDREHGWCDAVVITYRWRTSAGVDQTAYDTASVAGFSRVLALTYDRPWPGPGAASAILSRSLGRGHAQRLQAVSDYRARPGMALTVTLPDTEVQTGLLSAVTWRHPDDEMTVTTRSLVDTGPDAWARTPAGISWDDVAADIDWTEYAYTESEA